MVMADAAAALPLDVVTPTHGISKGYKQTEIGAIPDDWGVRRVGDVCRLINGRGFKPHEWRTRGLPIIRIQNLNGSDEFNYYDGYYDRKLEVRPGQLLFAWSGSRGTSFGPHVWHGPMGLLNYHTWKVMVDSESVSPTFFYYALEGLTEFIEGWAHGASALVHVQKWQMEGFQLAVPTNVKEQEAIGEALADTDQLIASLEALIAKKRAINQGAMQELLTGKRRLPGCSKPWRISTLGETCRSIVDGTHFTPTYVESGIPFYSVENVTADDFVNTKFITREEHQVLTRRCKPERGDILLTRIGAIGDTKLIDWDVDASIYVSLALLKCGDEINPQFLDAYAKGHQFRKDIEDRSLLNASPKKINMGDIGRVWIPVPERGEQAAIADIMGDMDDEVAALEQKLDKTRQIKQGMMHELLTGRVRPV
jgi:type I restriction enzyme, S subunit